MTQCDRILRHLESGGSLTAAQAMQEYGIYRLASRINDLKKRGVPIQSERQAAKTATAKKSAMPSITWSVEKWQTRVT